MKQRLIHYGAAFLFGVLGLVAGLGIRHAYYDHQVMHADHQNLQDVMSFLTKQIEAAKGAK